MLAGILERGQVWFRAAMVGVAQAVQQPVALRWELSWAGQIHGVDWVKVCSWQKSFPQKRAAIVIGQEMIWVAAGHIILAFKVWLDKIFGVRVAEQIFWELEPAVRIDLTVFFVTSFKQVPKSIDIIESWFFL